MHYDTTNPQGGVEGATVPEADDQQEAHDSIAEMVESDKGETVDGDTLDFDEADDENDAKDKGADDEVDEAESGKDEDGDDSGVEIEYEGETYRVPAELKDAFLRNADYTRKTQALAAERRKLEDERSHSQRREAVTAANLQDYTRILALSEQVQKFEAVNWQALQAQDPAAAQRLAQEYAQAKQARNEAAHAFQQKAEQQAHEAQRETARRVAEGHAVLARDIPDWSPDMGLVLKHFAVSNFGLSPDELGNVTDPRLVKILYTALLGDLRGRRAAEAKNLSAVQRTRPLPQVRAGGATATKNPARMSDAEYIEWRAKGGGD